MDILEINYRKPTRNTVQYNVWVEGTTEAMREYEKGLKARIQASRRLAPLAVFKNRTGLGFRHSQKD